jgi:acetyltransferase-like isoleucine patch superfamily enzyme
VSPDELGPALRRFLVEADEERRRSFDRSLSLDEAVSDRWERARRLGFAEGSSIYGSALVFGDVDVGPSTWVGPWTLLDGSGGGLRIGAHCSISAGVHLYTHDTVAWALSGGVAARRIGPVSIGDRCHIGAQAVVVAGVTVGRRCVVGANSFVNRDVPDDTVVVGSPARRVGRVVGEGADVAVELDDPGGG